MTGEQAVGQAFFSLLQEEQQLAQHQMDSAGRRNATWAAVDELVERVFLRCGPRAMELLAAASGCPAARGTESRPIPVPGQENT